MYNSNRIYNRVSSKKAFLFPTLVLVLIVIALIVKRPLTLKSALTTGESSASWTRCKHVSVGELDAWFHSTTSSQIPKIIHQTWKNETLRQQQALWSRTWCDQYTDWRFHLWTDDENDRFVSTKFPWFYPTYRQLSPSILRADSVRYMYMLYYGGLYVDLDYESIERVDRLFGNSSVVLSLINYSFQSMNSVPNSWMASKPNHPLWSYVLHRILLLWARVTDKERTDFWNGKAEFFTGPQSMFEGLMYYIKLTQGTDQSLDQIFRTQGNQSADAVLHIGNITFLGPRLMNAFDWMSGIGSDVCSAEKATFDEEKCKNVVKPIYAITYWSHSYGHGHENDSNYLAGKKPS